MELGPRHKMAPKGGPMLICKDCGAHADGSVGTPYATPPGTSWRTGGAVPLRSNPRLISGDPPRPITSKVPNHRHWMEDAGAYWDNGLGCWVDRKGDIIVGFLGQSNAKIKFETMPRDTRAELENLYKKLQAQKLAQERPTGYTVVHSGPTGPSSPRPSTTGATGPAIVGRPEVGTGATGPTNPGRGQPR